MAAYLGCYGEMVINVIALCTCAVVGLYAFKIVRLSRFPLGQPETLNPESGSEEGPRSLVAHSERALDRISEAVNRERTALQALKEKKETGAKRRGPARSKQQAASGAEMSRPRKKSPRSAKAVDPYAESVRLAAEGVDVKEISERVNLPRGEVLLALKLRARGAGAGRAV